MILANIPVNQSELEDLITGLEMVTFLPGIEEPHRRQVNALLSRLRQYKIPVIKDKAHEQPEVG